MKNEERRCVLSKNIEETFRSGLHGYISKSPIPPPRVGRTVEFRVPSAQVIERIIMFIGARYKHVRIHKENGSTNIPFSARISADP
jgi:hypothetical protein